MSELKNLSNLRKDLINEIEKEKADLGYFSSELQDKLYHLDGRIDEILNETDSVRIYLTDDIPIGLDERLMYTNIDDDESIKECLESGEYDIFSYNPELKIRIESGEKNKVYVSGEERLFTHVGEELGYLVPRKELEKSGTKGR